MNEAEYLYALLCECSDPQANVARLSKEDLTLLSRHITHLIRINGGKETGIPGLCQGLVEMEAAERYLK
jgi:hypothetical protein